MPYPYPKYPDEIFNDTDYPDQDDDTNYVYAWLVNALKEELQACLTELGTNPKGTHTDVKTRIEALEARQEKITIDIDGAGAQISTGIKKDARIPYNCEIQKATLLADQSGSIVIDIWKDTYANYPPDDNDSITAATPPEISTGIKMEDISLTNWIKAIAAGDTLRFHVDSCTTIQRVALILDVVKI